MNAPARFRDSGVIVLLRGHGDSLEVYWARRSDRVSVMPGFHAFIGGVVGPGDAAIPLAGEPDERLRLLRACAVREAFEEIGLLPAREGKRDPATLAEARERLLTGERPFEALAAELGWRFHADDLPFAGRWVTPPFATTRFDAAYFLARLPDGQQLSIQEGELAEGEWVRAADALSRWQRGQAVFAAPILHTLREIAAGDDDLAERLVGASQRLGEPHRIELQWGIVLRPMSTHPLPPATHTNAYLVGDEAMALVDPGSGEAREIEQLTSLVSELERDGRRLAMILVTHGHPDHIGGVDVLRARYRVPVMGHADTARLVPLDRTLEDGERVPLPTSGESWDLVAIHTPGHARGHLCFFHERTGALFTGDHVVGAGTVIVDPPEGDMTDYMGSLERLARLDARTLYPAHGSPRGAARRRIQALLAHRQEREAKVLGALSDFARPLAELLARAYDDTPKELWRYAERSLLAHLLKLEREGRATQEGVGWRRAS